MADLTFIPFEYPKSDDSEYMALLTEEGILKTRREQLGLTQQQVADIAGIQLSQYQRFESGEKYISGTSMRIGLAVCAALMLDPYELLCVKVQQPNNHRLKKIPLFDTDQTKDFPVPKRVGRKPLRKDITTVFVNFENYSFLIPYDILNKLGEPEYVNIHWDIDKRRVLISTAEKIDKYAIDVPEQIYDKSLYALPYIKKKRNPIAAMNWGKTPYAVEARIVSDRNNNTLIMIDLNTGKVVDTSKIEGVFMLPERFSIW